MTEFLFHLRELRESKADLWSGEDIQQAIHMYLPEHPKRL